MNEERCSNKVCLTPLFRQGLAEQTSPLDTSHRMPEKPGGQTHGTPPNGRIPLFKQPRVSGEYRYFSHLGPKKPRGQIHGKPSCGRCPLFRQPDSAKLAAAKSNRKSWSTNNLLMSLNKQNITNLLRVNQPAIHSECICFRLLIRVASLLKLLFN